MRKRRGTDPAPAACRVPVSHLAETEGLVFIPMRLDQAGGTPGEGSRPAGSVCGRIIASKHLAGVLLPCMISLQQSQPLLVTNSTAHRGSPSGLRRSARR